MNAMDIAKRCWRNKTDTNVKMLNNVNKVFIVKSGVYSVVKPMMR